MNRSSKRIGAGALALSGLLVVQAGHAQDSVLEVLPEEAQALYTDVVDVQESAFGDYAAPDGPWTWCHSESYMGNP